MELQERILPPVPVEVPGGFFQYGTVFWLTVTVALVGLLGWLLGRKLQKLPGRRQVIAEFIVGALDRLCRDTLGKRAGRKYLPLFGSLFLFVVACNMVGLIPISALTFGLFPEAGLEIGGEPYRDFNDNRLWDPGEPVLRGGTERWNVRDRKMGFLVPAPVEPTGNMNVPLGLSLVLAIGMYGVALLVKGPLGFAKGFLKPMWFMLPLNLIGAAAQIVSVSFRLFGNIFGGAVVLTIVGALTYHAMLPVEILMLGFLGLFIGAVQAFVFTMLWITYHSEHVMTSTREAREEEA